MAIAEGMDCSKLEDGMKVERKWYEAVIPTDDRLEGLAAFKERRVPEYKGKWASELAITHLQIQGKKLKLVWKWIVPRIFSCANL